MCRTEHRGVDRAHIHLHHFFAVALAGVLHRHAARHVVAVAFHQGQVAVIKRGVAQSVAKRELWLHILGVIVAITHHKAISKQNHVVVLIAEFLRWHVLQLLWP